MRDWLWIFMFISYTRVVTAITARKRDSKIKFVCAALLLGRFLKPKVWAGEFTGDCGRAVLPHS